MAIVAFEVLERYLFTKLNQDYTINSKLKVNISLHLFILEPFSFFIQNS